MLITASTLGLAAQGDPSWTEPFEPFRIAGNLYYVGTRGLSSFLLVTPDGNILIDTGTEGAGPLVRANVEKLGFKVGDIKVILASHAHFDHVGGHAAMQQLTNAAVMMVGEDAEALQSGRDTSALNGPGWRPVKVARLLKDNEAVSFGGITLTAHLTPGHTKGCTTWETTIAAGGRSYRVVFIGGTSVNGGVRLVGNTRHPGIAEDYARTFALLKTLHPDIFVAQHPGMFGMEQKAQRMKSGDASAFVDPDGFIRFVEGQEKLYLTQLQQERSK
jgi:metallo-beta-lactamase class B